MEKIFHIRRNFLSQKSYQKLERELPPMDNVLGLVRSHRDIYETDRITDRMPYWKHFFKYVHSGQMWFPFFKYLNTSDLLYQFSTEYYDPNYIEPRNGVVKEKDVFFYSRIDIGYGIEDYGRVNGGKGIHIDLPQRVMSALIYFSDQQDMTGGEFEIYSPQKELIRRVPIEKNMLILSIQNHNAYHAVNPIVKCNKPRIAVYMALSCSRPAWRTR